MTSEGGRVIVRQVSTGDPSYSIRLWVYRIEWPDGRAYKGLSFHHSIADAKRVGKIMLEKLRAQDYPAVAA